MDYTQPGGQPAKLDKLGVAGAICNAVYHATGKRLRHLPLTVDKLL